LFKKKSTGINFDKYNDIKVNASGNNVPAPIAAFAEGKFHEVLASNIELAGYQKPTPIQKYAIPISLKQRDLMACAQTGSGKTAAFLFPVLSLLLTTDAPVLPRGRKAYPSALIMTPTRELALQIYEEAQKFTYRTQLKAVSVYGGTNIGDQIRQIQRGCELVIATPGRLKDLLERNVISLSLIQFLILDEADQMLDMGFEREIRGIVEDYDMPSKRQTSMFSATFPQSIQRLAADFLENHVFLAVGRVGASSGNITQSVVHTPESKDKDSALMDVLSKCDGLTIVFVETKRKANWLENWLCDQNINAVSIHGDRTQQEREAALYAFKSKRAPVLVATSVAARGLDIPNVTTVVNYDLPSKFDDYIHRIGRTGRAGHKGNAIAFVNKHSRNLDQVLDTMKQADQKIEAWFTKLVRSSRSQRIRRSNRNGPIRDFRRGRASEAPSETFVQTTGLWNQGPPSVDSTVSTTPADEEDDESGCDDAW